jgi:hypothetical protein
MQKCSRREAMIILLGGMTCLGGCSTQTGFKKPTLPENCYWVEFKYAWFCLNDEVILGPSIPPRGLPPTGTPPSEAENSVTIEDTSL